MARLLRYDGYEVSAAYCGSVALELAESDPPDAVLSDISMPGMDGYEVAKRLRRMFHARVLLIAVTALSLEEDRKPSRQAGFDRHLVKPVDLQEVRRLLAAARDDV
jgi:CheY-like chemotaxis protein